MSAELLRRAAALMRERAEAAKGERPDWFVDRNGWDETELWARRDEWDYAPQPVIDEHSLRKTPGAFEHFAALTPAVALAVALLLENEAYSWQAAADSAEAGSDLFRPYNGARAKLLTSVARAYLGEAS